VAYFVEFTRAVTGVTDRTTCGFVCLGSGLSMPVTIGAKLENDFTNPLGLLQDCHRRIERFLGVIVEIIRETKGQHLDDQQRTALTTALRYFREAAPKHTEDEEVSLFPRLRESGGEAATDALNAVERLEADHVKAKSWHEQIEALGQRWLADGALGEQDSLRFQELSDQLVTLYQEHIDIEDNQLFPKARTVLTAEHLKAIGAEMADRRGIPHTLVLPVRRDENPNP